MANARALRLSRDRCRDQFEMTSELIQIAHPRFEEVFQNGLALLCTHDMQGRLLSVSPAAAVALDHAPGEATRAAGRSLADFLHPEVRGELDAYLESIAREGRVSGSLCLLSRSGKARRWRFQSTLTHDRYGQPYVIGCAQDATAESAAHDALQANQEELRQNNERLERRVEERTVDLAELQRQNRRREEAVREQSSLLRAVVESTADGLLVVARNGAITCFNSHFARMWRIPDDLLGAGRDEALLDYVRDQVTDPEAFLGRVRELYTQPEATSFDVLSLRDDRVFERYSQPQSVAGNVVGRVWSFRDVTEPRRVEAALRRNQYAIDHATEAILWTTQDGRLVYANASACRHLGYSQEELLRLCVADVGPDVPPEAWSERWRGLREARHVQLETRARRRDGTIFPAEVTIDHVRFEGVEYACATGRDISGRRALEERARRAEHTALMGSLTLGVAHEVRNPLFAISANLDALEHSLPLGEDAHAVMSAVRHEVDRLSALMARFIDYGASPAIPLLEDRLGPVVEAAASACAELAAGSGVRVELREAQCEARVRMIPPRVQHAFENLLRNAIQQSPRDGVVEVELTLVERGRRPWVRCEVRDSGPGFLEADLSRAFAPFFTRRRGSTGLGLSIAQRIVEEHEGHIHARNRSGGGAILTVDLPSLAQPGPETSSID